jgi:hypothetical protein
MGKMSNSPLYKYEKAMKDFQNAMVPIGEQFLKAFTPILDFVNGMLKQFNNLGDGTKGFITALVAGVAGIGPVVLMVFGLIANGVANLIKLFANFKSFFNNLGKSSKDLATSTQYMTSEQIEAAAIAASLDQVHGKLTQTFTSEAKAIQLLVAEYQKATAAQAVFRGSATPAGVVPKRFAVGGMVRGPGTGTSDSIPAMLSNGEAVIPAKSVSKNRDLVQSLINDSLPRYAVGGIIGGPSKSLLQQVTGTSAVVAYGAHQPFTSAHQGIAQMGMSMAQQSGAPFFQFTSNQGKAKRSLIGDDLKSKMISEAIGRNPEFAKNPFELMALLSKSGIKDVNILLGEDRMKSPVWDLAAKEYGINLSKTAIPRPAGSPSGTMARAAAASGNFELFEQVIASGLSKSTKNEILQNLMASGTLKVKKFSNGGIVGNASANARNIFSLLGGKYGANLDPRLAFKVRDSQALEALIKDGKYKNMFEGVESAARDKESIRQAVERATMGVPMGANPGQRPVYGFLTSKQAVPDMFGTIYPSGTPHQLTKDYKSYDPLTPEQRAQERFLRLINPNNRGLQSYGSATLYMKPELLAKASVSFGDTLTMWQQALELGKKVPMVSKLFKTNKSALAKKLKNSQDVLGGKWAMPYVEAHIPGGFSMKDVERIGITGNFPSYTIKRMEEVQKLLKENGLGHISVFDIGAAGKDAAKVLKESFKGYANGGLISGPGTGTSDSILARVSNGEAIIPAKSVSRYPGIVSQLVSGNIPGFSEGVDRVTTSIRPNEVRTYTDFTALLSNKANSDLKDDVANRQSVMREFRQNPVAIQGPLIASLAEQLGGATTQGQIDAFLKNNPHVAKYAGELSENIAGELSMLTTEKIGDKDLAPAVQRAIAKTPASAEVKAAVKSLSTVPTTFEDDSRLRQSKTTGRLMAAGRERLTNERGRYTSVYERGKALAQRLVPGNTIVDPVAAHLTTNKNIALSEVRSAITSTGMTVHPLAEEAFDRKERGVALLGPKAGGKEVPIGQTGAIEANARAAARAKRKLEAAKDGIEDAKAYNKAKKTILDRPENDPYAESRHRSSPHILAGPDGAQDGAAYNKARKLKDMELGVSEAEQSRLFSENMKKIEASEGYTEGKAHKDARVAVQRQENAEVLALVKEANAAEAAAMKQQNAAIMASGVPRPGFVAGGTTTLLPPVASDFTSRKELIAAEKAYQKAVTQSDKDNAKLAKKQARGGRGGGGMGAMMAMSMLPMAATALPGDIGKGAQDNMGLLMGLSMLPMLLPMLKTPLGALVAVIGSVVAGFLMLRSAFDETQKKVIESGNAFKASTEAVQKYAVFNNKVTASEIRDRQRLESLSPYGVKAGNKTFGESFVETEAGKDLSNRLAKLTAAGDKLQAEKDLTSQLATAVLSGALDMKQAKSIAVNVAKAAGDVSIGTQAIAKLTDVMGMDGEKAVSNPVGVRLQLMEQQEKQLLASSKTMGSKISSGDRIMATREMQGAGVGAGVAGGFAVGSAIGAGIGLVGSGGVLSVPAALIGGAIGAIVGGIGTYVAMLPTVEKIAKFTAATSIDAKILLETNKQLLDSYDLQFQTKHQQLLDQGKITEAAKLEQAYLEKRNKLTTQIAESQKTLVDQYNKEEGLQQALMDGAKKATDAKYKDNANELAYLDVARKMTDDLKNAGNINAGQAYLIELKMASGDLPPSQARGLLEYMTDNKDMAPKVMSIITKFSGQESSQAAQVLAMLNDPGAKKDFIQRVSLQPTSEAAKRFLDVMSNVAQADGILDIDMQVGYYSRVGAAKNSVMKDFEDINDAAPKTQTEINKIVSQTTYTSEGSAQEYMDYVTKLKPNEQKTYTKVISQVMNVDVTTTITSEDFQKWLGESWTDSSGVERGGLRWANASQPQQLSRYADDRASQTVQTGIDLSTATAPVASTSSGSGNEPQASFLDEVVKSYRDVFNWQQKTTIGFTKSKAAIDKFAVTGFNGLMPKLAAAGVGPELMRAIIDAPQSEIDQIVDKTTGKIKTSFLKTLPKVMAAMNPFSKQNIAARWLLMTEDQKDQQRINMYQAGLDVIKIQEDKINKSYDERIEALDKIQSLQDKTNQQQQDTLSLADALSKGDIAAAARAAQQMKQNNAKAAMDATRESLQNARQTALDAITVKINGKVMTRAEAEAEILTLTNKMNIAKLTQLNREIAIGDQLDRQVNASRTLAGAKGGAGGGGGGGGGGNPGGKPTPTPTPVPKPVPDGDLKLPHSLQWKYMQTDIKDLTTKIAEATAEMVSRAEKYPFVTSIKDSEKDMGNNRLSPDEQRALYEYRAFRTARTGYEQERGRIQRNQHALGENGPLYKAVGGYIAGAGTGTSDSIPAMLSNGEYVIRANAVKTIGVDALDKLNQADRMKFAVGGLVPPKPTIPTGSKGSPNRSINTDNPKDVAGKLEALNASIESARTRLADADPKDTGRILILKQQLARAIAALSGYTYVPPAMPSEDMMKTFKNPKYKETMGKGNGEVEYFNRYPTLADFIKYKTNRLIGGRTKINSNGEYIYSPNGKPFEWMKDTFYGSRDKTLMSILGDAGYMHTWNLFGRDVAKKMPYEKLPGIISDMGVIARDSSNWQVYRARQMRLAGIHGGSDNWVTQINSDLNYDYYRNLMKKSNGGMVRYANGGMVIPRFKSGGYVGMMPRFGDGGLANLHTGEYVFQKAAVDRIGINNLNNMNEGVAGIGDSVYNYNINLNVSSMSNQDDIADAVLSQIKRLDSQRIRRTN